MYFRDNKAGSMATLQEHLGIPADEADVIWDQLHNTFAAELPKDLFREIFEFAASRPDRRKAMAGGQAAARP